MGDYSLVFLAFAFFYLLPVLETIIVCRKSRFRKSESTIVDGNEFSSIDKEIINEGCTELEALGFSKWYYRSTPASDCSEKINYSTLVLKKELDTHTIIATIYPKLFLFRAEEMIVIEFHSILDQDCILSTHNGLTLNMLLMNDNVISNLCATNAKKMLSNHLEKLSELSLTREVFKAPTPEETEQLFSKTLNNHIDRLVQKGELVDQGEEGLILDLKACLRRVNLFKNYKKKVKSHKELPNPDRESIIHSPEAMAKNISYSKLVNDMPTYFSRKEIFGSFILSAILAALSFGLSSSNTESVLIILLVIFIHELGHALGMYLFGYKNIKLFFIPFFGGIAVGKRPENNPTGEILMLLLGPIPGLIIGTAILLASDHTAGFELQSSSFIYSYASMSILINGFNLLPVEPLDGGKIMQLILFSRFPRFQAIFSGFSGFFLLLTFNPILFIIGITSILSVRSQFKSAATINHLKRNQLNTNLDQACLYINETIPNKYLSKMKGVKRIKFFNTIIERTKIVPVKMVPSLVLMSIYLFSCIIIPTIAYIRINEISAKNDGYDQFLGFALPVEYSEMKYKESKENNTTYIGDIPAHYYTEREQMEMHGLG